MAKTPKQPAEPAAPAEPAGDSLELPVSPDGAPAPETAPEEARDDGMGTAREDLNNPALSFDVENPEEVDKGAGAVFPIMRDDEMPTMPALADGDVAVPPAEAAAGAPLFSDGAVLPPGPEAGLLGGAAPLQSVEQAAQPELVEHFITNERLDSLWTRIDQAKTQIDAKIQSLVIARQLLDQLKYARNELLGGRDRYEEAERYLNEIEYRTIYSQNSLRWAINYGTVLFIYELVWGILTVGAFFFLLGPQALSGGTDLRFLIGAMLWGSFGGVIGALNALIKHVALEQDFDKQHTVWYLASPVLGLLVGMFVFGVARIGLLAVVGPAQGIESPWPVYILASLCGFQHHIFTELIKRIIKVFELAAPKSEAPKAPAADEPASPPTLTDLGGPRQ